MRSAPPPGVITEFSVGRVPQSGLGQDPAGAGNEMGGADDEGWTGGHREASEGANTLGAGLNPLGVIHEGDDGSDGAPDLARQP